MIAAAVETAVARRKPQTAPILAMATAVAFDTGNLANELLAILANEEIGNERFDPSEWRIEVYTNRNGRRYWNHRRRGKRGGKQNWKFGGTFDELSPERQAEYWQRAKNV